MLKATTRNMGAGIILAMLGQEALGEGVCERFKTEIKSECAANVQFYGANGQRELLITGLETPDDGTSYNPKEVCFYPQVPGLMSVHGINATCEEQLQMAANLCFREGLTAPDDLKLEDIRSTRICEKKSFLDIFNPQISKAYLWGAGFAPTKFIILVDNIGGFLELRESALADPGVSRVNPTIVRIPFNDLRFTSIFESLKKIKIEYLSPEECYEYKELKNRPLINIDALMIDGTTPDARIILLDGDEIVAGPCVDVRGFFPNFDHAVEVLSRH